MRNERGWEGLANDTVELGSAPASGAVGRALAAHYVHPIRSLFGALLHAGVRREGAPDSSRGGRAPLSFQLHGSGLGGIPAKLLKIHFARLACGP